VTCNARKMVENSLPHEAGTWAAERSFADDLHPVSVGCAAHGAALRFYPFNNRIVLECDGL
jgi:hypothetical protein